MLDTIAGRTLLVLILGLTLSHAASMAMYFLDRSGAIALAGVGHAAERIATVIALLERSPAAERPAIVARAGDRTLRITLSDTPSLDEKRATPWLTELLRDSLRAHLGGARTRALVAGRPDPATMRRQTPAEGKETATPSPEGTGPNAVGQTIVASFRLQDGAWINFVAPLRDRSSIWSVKFVLSTIVMIAAIVILSAIVVRHLVAPLQAFARAAERLGTDVNAPPLPERGPREVRKAAQAFNEMQRRIRRFLDDRTRMLAAISHDLRTPITRLRLRAEFVEDEGQRERMLHDLDEMDTMIASLLSFAREDAADEPTEVIDLTALVESICDDMTDLGEEVRFRGPGRLPYACRRLALRRAFTNLIENAVRYGGGAEVTLGEANGRIRLVIEDEGPGIPEEEQERAFDAFYRIEGSRNRRTGGSGVGLYVARAVVRGHGGDIRLANRPRGGLRVEVTLPRRPG